MPPKKPAGKRSASSSPKSPKASPKKSPTKKAGKKAASPPSSPTKKAAKKAGTKKAAAPAKKLTLQLIGDEWLPSEKISVECATDKSLADGCVPSVAAALQVRSLVGLLFHKTATADATKCGVATVDAEAPLSASGVLENATLYVRKDRTLDLTVYVMGGPATAPDRARQVRSRVVYVPLHDAIELHVPAILEKAGLPRGTTHAAARKEYTLLWGRGRAGPDGSGLAPSDCGVAVKKSPAQLGISGGAVVWVGRNGTEEVGDPAARAGRVPLPTPTPALQREPSEAARRLLESGPAFDALSRWRLEDPSSFPPATGAELYLGEDDMPVPPPDEASVARLREAWRSGSGSPERAHRTEEEARRVVASYAAQGRLDEILPPPPPPPPPPKPSSPLRSRMAASAQAKEKGGGGEEEEAATAAANGGGSLKFEAAWGGFDPRAAGRSRAEDPDELYGRMQRGEKRGHSRSGGGGDGDDGGRDPEREALLRDRTVLDSLWATRSATLFAEVGSHVRDFQLAGTAPLGDAAVAASLALCFALARQLWAPPPPVEERPVPARKRPGTALPYYHAAVDRRRKLVRRVLQSEAALRFLDDDVRRVLAVAAAPSRARASTGEEEYEGQEVLGRVHELQQVLGLVRSIPTFFAMIDPITQRRIVTCLEHPLREGLRHRSGWDDDKSPHRHSHIVGGGWGGDDDLGNAHPHPQPMRAGTAASPPPSAAAGDPRVTKQLEFGSPERQSAAAPPQPPPARTAAPEPAAPAAPAVGRGEKVNPSSILASLPKPGEPDVSGRSVAHAAEEAEARHRVGGWLDRLGASSTPPAASPAGRAARPPSTASAVAGGGLSASSTAAASKKRSSSKKKKREKEAARAAAAGASILCTVGIASPGRKAGDGGVVSVPGAASPPRSRSASPARHAFIYNSSTVSRAPLDPARLSVSARAAPVSIQGTHRTPERGRVPHMPASVTEALPRSLPGTVLTRFNSDLDLLERGRTPGAWTTQSGRSHGESAEPPTFASTGMSALLSYEEQAVRFVLETFYAEYAPSKRGRVQTLVAAVMNNASPSEGSVFAYLNEVLRQACATYRQSEAEWLHHEFPPRAVVRYTLRCFYTAYDRDNADRADALVDEVCTTGQPDAPPRRRALGLLLEALCRRWERNGACYDDWALPYPRCLELTHQSL